MVNCIEQIYQNTKSAIWNGEDLSYYFDTKTGVKQECLLSPLLFALYLNDLQDSLKGGLTVDGINIRLLMYADDIVILAEEVEVVQQMIKNLEEYCHLWGMEKKWKNQCKEVWNFSGQTVKIVSEYKYWGIILTLKVTKKITWNDNCINIIETMKTAILQLHKGQSYCNEAYSQEQISYILKARADLLPLNGNQYREYKHIRIHAFAKAILTNTELIQILNGEDIIKEYEPTGIKEDIAKYVPAKLGQGRLNEDKLTSIPKIDTKEKISRKFKNYQRREKTNPMSSRNLG
ncbi:hypothetical protein CVS40_12972 [Lucilia cuprina]|nr:hypothetical protein CVS40_12972 [Lucilia cuprina]